LSEQRTQRNTEKQTTRRDGQGAFFFFFFSIPTRRYEASALASNAFMCFALAGDPRPLQGRPGIATKRPRRDDDDKAHPAFLF
jgi:hypothetical protein